MTQMRLYKDTRREYKDYQGKYTLYFPYPKWLQKTENGATGYGIVCEPTEGGMWRIEGIYNDGYGVNSNNFYLGRRIKLESMPEAFQICANRLAKAWHDAIKYNTPEYWKKWLDA